MHSDPNYEDLDKPFDEYNYYETCFDSSALETNILAKTVPLTGHFIFFYKHLSNNVVPEVSLSRLRCYTSELWTYHLLASQGVMD